MALSYAVELSANHLSTFIAFLAAAGVAGLLQIADAPLPWLIGPLLCIATASGLRAPIRIPSLARPLGQALAGTALGLHFTLPVLLQVGSLWGWIAFAVVASVLLSTLSSRVLSRVGRADPATAFFASAIGGAAEMAVQAERFGARVDQVAAAHSVRVLFVVILTPFAFRIAGVHGSDPYVTAPVPLDALGLVGLLGLGALAGLMFAWLRVPNGWLFGPMLVTSFLTATGNAPSSMPVWLVNGGQLLIGCYLGGRFVPEFFSESPRFLFGVLMSGLLLLACCVLVGTVIGVFSPIPLPTAILATVPGGLAEMGITATVLQLGAPVVTAFHTVRLLFVVVSSGPVYRLVVRQLK